MINSTATYIYSIDDIFTQPGKSCPMPMQAPEGYIGQTYKKDTVVSTIAPRFFLKCDTAISRNSTKMFYKTSITYHDNPCEKN